MCRISENISVIVFCLLSLDLCLLAECGMREGRAGEGGRLASFSLSLWKATSEQVKEWMARRRSGVVWGGKSVLISNNVFVPA